MKQSQRVPKDFQIAWRYSGGSGEMGVKEMHLYDFERTQKMTVSSFHYYIQRYPA